VASPEGGFHVFNVGATPIAAVRRRFSAVIALSEAGGMLLLAAWRDSSLTMCDLSDAKSAQRPLYRKTPHRTASKRGSAADCQY
jgi:hypothetical protein